MANYTRQDNGKIANGNVIDADDFDAEFNALENAFGNIHGHKHDGSEGEGAPIEKVGPAQDVVFFSSKVEPKTDNVVDLGSPNVRFKDAFLSGSANVAGTLTVTGSIAGDVTGDVKAANGTTVLDSGADGTDATFTGDVTGTVSSLSNHSTTDLSEGTNLYYTDARVQSAISVTDAGGDGSLTKSGGTITYTGPSATETRAHFSAANAGTGLGSLSYSNGVFTFNKITDADLWGRFIAGEGIDFSAGEISAEDATYTNKGIASFSSTHFNVSSGFVSIQTEHIQDTVGAMVSNNTESGIIVTYQDTDGTLDFSLSTESVQDIVGAMVTGNTESNISVLYDDTDGTLDFIINSNPSLQNLDVLNDTTLKNVYVSDLVRTPYVYTSGLELTLGANSVVEAKVTSAGVNIYNGLVVGNSTTTPTDNDIYATGQVEAAQGFKVGSWTVTETSGGALLFSDGTDLLMKLYPSTGNLQIAGTLSQNVSISPV